MTITMTPISAIPPLQNGDQLTRDEFERRYHAMPGLKWAELIEGVVYMPSPVSHEFHGGPHVDVAAWLGVYRASTPGADAGDNSTVRLDTDNEPQTDVILFVRPDHGGRVVIDHDGYIAGSPDLVAEVSASSASLDLNKKLHAYRRNRVTEYLVWRVYDAAVDWFVFRDGRFDQLPPDPADGLMKSEAFPGLWLDPAALVRRDLGGVLAALTRGLGSSAHAAFVARLAARRITP
ncbi:MAG: hypothetical protein JWO38_4271 [Gemmataceae bacterium]|nr:hypothetical protein [Gemmataceae bacterium]